MHPTTPAKPAGRQTRSAIAIVAAIATVVAISAVADGHPRRAATADVERTATCTFTNRAYAGECVEQTTVPADSTAVQACTAILDCLNNPRCQTTYCRATTVRTGWKLAKAEETTAASR